MDMYLIDQLPEAEIAEIKNLPTEGIQKIISEKNKSNKTKPFKRIIKKAPPKPERAFHKTYCMNY